MLNYGVVLNVIVYFVYHVKLFINNSFQKINPCILVHIIIYKSLHKVLLYVFNPPGGTQYVNVY